jgi:hypothetical protein
MASHAVWTLLGKQHRGRSTALNGLRELRDLLAHGFFTVFGCQRAVLEVFGSLVDVDRATRAGLLDLGIREDLERPSLGYVFLRI